MKRAILLSTLILIYALGCFTLEANSQERRNRPNFVFFLVDDLGWKDLACYGSTFHETPNIDALAESGMKFTDAYTASPVCSPTRAAIMTGKHPARVGIMDWIPGRRQKQAKLIPPEDRHQLPLEEVTIAEALKADGYVTFFAGKWHLGSEGFYPEDQGFDINMGGHEKGSPPQGYFSPYGNPRLMDGPEGEYLTDRLGDEAVKFLKERDTARPFLLYFSFYTVHTPIMACPRHLPHYQAKAEKLPAMSKEDGFEIEYGCCYNKLYQDRPDYATMVQALDDNVGKVLDELQKQGLKGNTVIIFTSDNGGLSTGAKPNRPTANRPLRMGKGWCFEGGIRVPLIVHVPGLTEPGTTNNSTVISMDFYPTILELAGLPLRPSQHVDGISFVSLLKGENNFVRDAVFWYYPYYHGSQWRPGAAIRAGNWKLVEFFESGWFELFDLKNDIAESQNLALEKPEKAQALRQKLYSLIKENGAELPVLNPDFVPDETKFKYW